MRRRCAGASPVAFERTPSRPDEGHRSMGWLRDEVWFDIDTDVLWFREQPRKPFAPLALESAFTATFEPALAPVANGLEESRRRRHQAQAARKRRLATRTVPAVALVLGSATMLPIAAFALGAGGRETGPRERGR